MNSFEAADDKELWPRGMKLVHAKKQDTSRNFRSFAPFPQSSNEVFRRDFRLFRFSDQSIAASNSSFNRPKITCLYLIRRIQFLTSLTATLRSGSIGFVSIRTRLLEKFRSHFKKIYCPPGGSDLTGSRLFAAAWRDTSGRDKFVPSVSDRKFQSNLRSEPPGVPEMSRSRKHRKTRDVLVQSLSPFDHRQKTGQ